MRISSTLLAFMLSVVMVGCSDNPIDDSGDSSVVNSTSGKHIVVSLYSNTSRVSVTPEDDYWSVDWESDDVVVGWFSETTTMEQFSMESLDESTGLAKFEGTGYSRENMRFIYPYNHGIENNSGSITLSVASQSVDLTDDSAHDSFGENSLYMLSDSFAVDEYESVSTTMRHIFTILELTFNVSDIEDGESLIVTDVTIDGLGDHTVTIPFSHVYTDALTTVSGDDDTISLDITGASALTNGDGVLKIPVVAVPFELSTGQQIDWEVTFSDGRVVGGSKVIAEANNGEQFKRAEYNTFGITFSADDVAYPAIDQESYLLSEISLRGIPVGDEWTITDVNSEGSLTSANFLGLIDAITAANSDGRAPKITFSNLKNLPDYAMSLGDFNEADRNKEFSVYLPVVEAIPQYAFQQCRGLSYVYAPKATSIGIYGLGNCYGLQGFDLSSLASATSNSFRYVPMTSIELPSLTSFDGGSVFNFCYSITSIELGAGDDCDGVNFINSNALYYISTAYQTSGETSDLLDLTNIDLTIRVDPSSTDIVVDAENNTLKLNNANTYTFKSITLDTKPVTNFNGTLSQFTDTYTSTMGTTWTITDTETSAYGESTGYHDDFDNLIATIQSANTAGETPKLIFTNLIELPEYAFFNGTDSDNGLGFTLELQEVVTVGSHAIRRCNKLTAIMANKLKYAGARIISNSGCTSISFPELCGQSSTNAVLGGQTFRGSGSLTSVTLPKVTKLGANEFNACSLLTYIELGTDDDCSGVTYLTLNTNSNSTFYNLTKIAEATLKIKVGADPNFEIDGNVLYVPDKDNATETYTFGSIIVVD